MIRLAAALLAIALLATASPTLAQPARAATPDLTVEGTDFVYRSPGGLLRSIDLAGAEMDMVVEGAQATVRIASAARDKDRPAVVLLDLQVRGGDGQWRPLCDPDFYGRRLGFPVAGRWAADGSYIKDTGSWFLTCTGGSQGKCILWGYDPWGQDANGRSLAPYYQACQHLVRADYDGSGAPHTRNGTTIDLQDDIGIQTWESAADPALGFEAGWGPSGAVCVARTRWPDLLKARDLWRAQPGLAGACTPKAARARGALLYTRVVIR